VICTLVPDDVIPELPITPKPDALWVLASGYAVALNRIDPNCDVGMVAPRMLWPAHLSKRPRSVGRCTVSAQGLAKPDWARMF